MTEELTTKAVAERLGTEPRTLRRFLRDDPTYRNAGSGGRYTFTERDMLTLSQRFCSWQSGVAERRAARDTTGLQRVRQITGPEPEEIEIPRCNAALWAKELADREKINARLRECGLSLSNLNRPEWVS